MTENGVAWDGVPVEGRVDDPLRIACLSEPLAAVREAIREGAPVGVYLAWSLPDNRAWAFGYDKRFGIAHGDYET